MGGLRRQGRIIQRKPRQGVTVSDQGRKRVQVLNGLGLARMQSRQHRGDFNRARECRHLQGRVPRTVEQRKPFRQGLLHEPRARPGQVDQGPQSKREDRLDSQENQWQLKIATSQELRPGAEMHPGVLICNRI